MLVLVSKAYKANFTKFYSSSPVSPPRSIYRPDDISVQKMNCNFSIQICVSTTCMNILRHKMEKFTSGGVRVNDPYSCEIRAGQLSCNFRPNKI